MDSYDPGDAHLWTPAQARDGSRRSVTARTVFFPFVDPERPAHLPPASSSGVAAHPDLAEARSRAFLELVERDHFMWTWVQRISRERIDRRTLPAEAARLLAVAESAGYEVDLINLSLDVHPVILCAAHSDSVLQLGCACHPEPRRAVVKALEEATTGLGRVEDLEHLEAREVSGPLDHERFYRSPDRVAEAEASF